MTDIVGLERERTVCFTGHRVQKLPWCSDESDEGCIKMKETLLSELEKAIMNEYCLIIVDALILQHGENNFSIFLTETLSR